MQLGSGLAEHSVQRMAADGADLPLLGRSTNAGLPQTRPLAPVNGSVDRDPPTRHVAGSRFTIGEGMPIKVRDAT
jgi:hypothetical protein